MNTVSTRDIDHWRAIFQSMSDGVTICDAMAPDLPLIYVNPAFEQMTGYSSAEVCERNCRFLQGNDRDQPGVDEIRAAIREKREARVLLKNHRKDGTMFWNDFHLSLMLGEDGALTHFVGIQNDVTAQVEATLKFEREAERRGNEADLILKTVGEGIYGLDRDGFITFANPAAEAMTGWASEELVGKVQHAIVHPAYACATTHPVEDSCIYKALRAGVPFSSDSEVFWRKDDTAFPVTYTSTPITTNGGPSGAVVVFKDISKRKHLEAWERSKNAILFGITSLLPLEATLSRIAQAYVDYFPVCSAAFFLATGTHLRLSAHAGISKSLQLCLAECEVGDDSTVGSRSAYLSSEVLMTRTSGESAPFREFSDASVAACLAVPLHSASGKFLGVCEILATNESQFDRDARESLYIALDLARLAIDHYQLHAALVREHDRAEQALSESEGRFRIMADSCPALIWVTDEKGEIEFINREYRELCGIEIDELHGEKWLALTHPDDAEALFLAFSVAVREQAAFEEELRIRSSDGAWRNLISRAAPRFSSSGDFLGHVGVSLDITDRKRAEALLVASTERLTLAVRAGAIGIWEWDVVRQQLHWDDQMLSLYGITREEFGGHFDAWKNSLHPDDVEAQVAAFGSSLRGEKEFDTEFRVVWPDTSVHTIRAQSVLQRGPSGEPSRVIGTNFDITTQKQAADELMESNRLLRETTERARELATAATVANTAKSAFLANMSHEIRTPMNGIFGMIQLLLTTDLTPEQRQYGEIAINSGKSLLALINDILDLSKIEAGKITIEMLEFDLPNALGDMTESWKVQADSKGLSFHVDIGTGIPRFVSGDAHRLGQILNNLVSNAIKFTDQGGIAFRVDMVKERTHQTTVRFAMTDTGIGIGPEQITRLFSPFVQADASTTRKFGGTGLGLAICKQLVALMGGEIGVDSREGTGSTFWFTLSLPVVDTVCTGAQSNHVLTNAPWIGSYVTPGQALLSTQTPISAKRSFRVLVAEDNPTNRLVAIGQLGKLGYDADVVFNGAEAVVANGNTKYELILMDCSMPVMDGYEATRQIRKSGNRDIPIIAVTANAMEGDRDKCIGAGMSGYLSKPIDIHELAKILEKWCHVEAPGVSDVAIPDVRDIIFDPDSLLGRLMGDRELGNMITKGFVDDFPRQLANLQKALADGNREDAQMAGHTLKGSSATVSANRLSAVGHEMEDAASQADLIHFGQLLPLAVREFDQLRHTLQQTEWL